jgi:hypothetical protein
MLPVPARSPAVLGDSHAWPGILLQCPETSLNSVDGVRRGPGGGYKNFSPKVVAKVALLSLLAGERDIVDMFSHASRILATTRTNRPPFLLHGRELKESVMRTFSQHDF